MNNTETKKKPVLLIMAAGLGRRFGGDKQTTEMTAGDWILDYSLYDAYMAGFEEAVIVTRKELEDEVRAHLDNSAGKRINIQYAFQDINDLLGLKPEDIPLPDAEKLIAERSKPWGTAHAVLAARDLINGPFAVINADDFYGSSAFAHIYEFLNNNQAYDKEHFAMIGYKLNMTLSETGTVSRGVCNTDENLMLTDITERKTIGWIPGSEDKDGLRKIGFYDGPDPDSEEEKEKALADPDNWVTLEPDTMVSMNFWGFSGAVMDELKAAFPQALAKILETNPGGEEFLLPFAVDELLQAGKADVKVLPTSDKWYGVTNLADLPLVRGALQSLKDKEIYPTPLWSKTE